MADNIVDPQSVVDEALKNGTVAPTAPVVPDITLPQTPPTPPVTPEPVAPAPIAPLSQDMPLAFVKQPDTSAPTPPPTPTPQPTIPVEPPKKKSKLGVVFAGILGLFVVLGGSVFGYLYYTENLPISKSTVANIQTKYPDRASCQGTCDAGRLLRWDAKNDRCEDSGKPCDWEGQVTHSEVVDCTTPGSKRCDGCGGFCITPIKETCNEMQVIKCGEAPITGATCMSVAPKTEADKKRFFYPCNCDGTQYWFDAQGFCGKKDDGYSLCAVTKYATCLNDENNNEHGAGQLSCDFECNNSGCKCTSDRNECKIYHWKCDRIDDLSKGCQDGQPKIGTSASFNSDCGSEQIDVVCHGDNVTFRTRVNDIKCGGSSPKPSTTVTTTYSMSCTGLTKNVTSPTIGSKVTFTCAGATVPAAGASLLQYNFRYNVDSGTWKTLTNKTNNTAELTVNACGTYTVQCRACVTYNGTTTCDPIWQGATQ